MEVEQRQKSYINQWDPDNFNEDYMMESNMFDYELIKKS